METSFSFFILDLINLDQLFINLNDYMIVDIMMMFYYNYQNLIHLLFFVMNHYLNDNYYY
jgi:hypothetical protein